jgi:Arc/MetJ-type ribon-helix-helix transcriptional regulator
MKLSVSLHDDDVAFIDQYAEARGIPSRSAVVHRAVELLRLSELGPSYAEAWAEWASGGEGEAWEASVADGLDQPA